MTYTKTIIISCLIFCFNYSAFAYSPPAGYSEEFNTNISIALSKNGVRGCGYLVWKNLVQNDSKYLIFCSRDGEEWRPYTVWLPSGKVQLGHKAKKKAVSKSSTKPNLAWSVTLCRSLGGMDAQTFITQNATKASHLQLALVVGNCKKFENGPYEAKILKQTKKYILVQIPSENNVIGWTYSFNIIE